MTSHAAEEEQSLTRQRKEAIRREMALRREGLPPDVVQENAVKLRKQALLLLDRLAADPAFPAQRPLEISVYSAMRQEADLAPLWPDLLRRPARLYFPAVTGRGEVAAIVLGRLPEGTDPGDFLVPGRFGVMEPPPSSWLGLPPPLDLVFVPGLAFDRNGGRLGWGKAFYDHLLAVLPGHPVRIGVCLGFQIVDTLLPQGPGDIKMQWLLTPEGFAQTAADSF
jgi:5-formyltetrahydrofolate cyclo-ligase